MMNLFEGRTIVDLNNDCDVSLMVVLDLDIKC